MSTVRSVLGGAAWIYGAQVISVIAQFAYAAVTSRLVDGNGFGAYAVALSASGFANLVAVGGIGQAVGRAVSLEKSILQALLSYAVIVGAIAGSITFACAPLWSVIWGAPTALHATQFAAISVAIAPAVGLGAGLLRRRGRFRGYALVSVLGNLAGMIVGAVCVYVWPGAVTLLVSAIFAQLVVLAYSLATGWPLLGGLRSPVHARAEISYSWRLMATSVVSFVNGNLIRLAVSRTLGVSSIGQWNRAEMVTSVPVQQLQTALAQAIYPEFRHHRDDPLVAKRVWTDMLIVVSWVVLPACALLAAISPKLIAFLFGPGWGGAQSIAPTLAILAAVQLLGTLLGHAIESLGRFAWIWTSTAAVFVVVVVVATFAAGGASLEFAVAGTLAALLARHIVQIVMLSRAGYLEPWRLVAHYVSASFMSVAVAITVLAPSLWAAGWWVSGSTMLLLVGIAVFAWRQFPPLVIVRKYGLFR